MGAEGNTVEQPPQDTTSESVDALLEAARYDDIDDLMSIASVGVSLDSKDSEGRTALHMASANGHLDIVDYLISNGVAANFPLLREHIPESDTLQLTSVIPTLFENILCIAACFMGNGGVISQKLEDVNASNTEKNTPLHWACLNGHIEVVKRLVLAGASLSLLNSHERTPVDEAVSRGKLDVIDAINEAAAQVELTGTRVSESVNLSGDQMDTVLD